jgi:hypothetical protein
VRLTLAPCSIQDAKAFVAQYHRHHKPPPSGLFAVACTDGETVVGVAIVGRPVARMSDDGWTAEVTRLCVLPGNKNACSMLYGAAWRAARALGWQKLITYVLPEEGGASLRASGWKCLGEAGGGSWSRKERPRVDKHPTQVKMKYAVGLAPRPSDPDTAKESKP